jgi:hypothetical protein
MANSDDNLARLRQQIQDSIDRVRDSVRRTKDLLSNCSTRNRTHAMAGNNASPRTSEAQRRNAK